MAERLGLLECRCRTYRLISFGSLVASLLLFVMGAIKPTTFDRIEAQDILFRDASGQVVMDIGIERSSNRPMIHVLSKDGMTTNTLTSEGVYLYSGVGDHKGRFKPRAEYRVGPNGQAGLTLRDTRGTDRVEIGVEEAKSAVIKLLDVSETCRLHLNVQEGGIPRLSLCDGGQTERAVLTSDENGRASLGFKSSAGAPVSRTGETK